MKSHLYKRPDAVILAKSAICSLEGASDLLRDAERQLKSCGYRGAQIGIRQAHARVISWLEKIRAEVK
jgi:hypothetical protein